MSRKSRKPRAAVRGSSPPQWLESWSQRSLLDLLTAAACSPGSLHRLPSISFAIQEVTRLRPSGTDTVPAERLKDILDAMLSRDSRLRSLEDFMPLNPSQCVRVRVRGRRYRLHPASLERPVAGIARVLRVGQAVDDTLVELVGFGITDLLELVLGYVDSFVGVCSPFWPATVAEDVDTPPVVTAAEIDALQYVPPIETIAEKCTNPGRAKRALEWGIIGPDKLRFEPDGDSSFGHAIAVRLAPHVVWPMPPSLQMESFFKGVQELAARAALASTEAKRKFHDISLKTIGKCLPKCISQQPDGVVEHDNSRQFLIPSAFRHWLVIEMVSKLGPDPGNEAVHEAVERLMAIEPGHRYLSSVGRVRCIPHDAQVMKLLVVSAPGHLGLLGPPGIGRMTLDELEWISRSASDCDDLYLYLREIAQASTFGRLMSLEAIDSWEFWRSNGKALHRVGIPMTSMVMAPHQGDIEWEQAAEREELEARLFALGFPELREWNYVKIEERRLYIANYVPTEAWVVSLGPRLIAVNSHNERGSEEPFDLLEHLAESLMWTLEHVEAQLLSLLGRMTLTFAFVLLGQASEGPYIRFGSVDAQRCITIECLVPCTFDDNVISEIEPHLRLAALEGLRIITTREGTSLDFELLRAAVMSQPSALSIEVTQTPQRSVQLPQPQQPHESLISAASRSLAEHLRAKGVAAGEHNGGDAVKLETQVIYPFLKAEILHKCRKLNAKVLIEKLANELECASYWRAFRRQSLDATVRNISVAFDPVERSMEFERDDSAIQRRFEFLIELALANPPAGTSHPDRMELRDIISVASLCIESGFRGEAAHYRLEPVATVISDMYGITSRPCGDIPLDWTAYERQKKEVGMERAGQNRATSQPSSARVVGSQKMRADNKLFSGVDDAMLAAYGFSSKCLVNVLRAITRLAPHGPSPIARISIPNLVAEIGSMPDYPKDQIVAAVGALVLRVGDLQAEDIEPWEFSKRSARITVRPLPLVAEDDVLVMPWFVEKTLTVYRRYLADGRLPWPKNAIHPIVDDALKKYRSARNTDLEDEVAHRLESAGYRVAKRIKKAKVIGLSALAGEIDAIVVNEGRGIIWVLEVKDPEEAFSIAEIERSVRRFHGAGEWVDKLAKKLANVRENPDGVALALGAQSRSEWQVRGALVTREVVPAAFVRNVRFPFTTVEQVVEMVSSKQ